VAYQQENDMATKQTPKSCSCRMCKRGKMTKAGNIRMKHDERSFRHSAKVAIKKGIDFLGIAPKGNYYD